jgi:hypothetical protein
MKTWLTCLLLLLGSSTALAVPQTMSFTGRISTGSGPVNGTVSVNFAIYDAVTNGTKLW